MDEELDEIAEKARLFSMCLECGNLFEKIKYMHSN